MANPRASAAETARRDHLEALISVPPDTRAALPVSQSPSQD